MTMATTVLEKVEKNLEECKATAEVANVPNSEDHTTAEENGKLPELVYSKELLLKLKQHPASLVKPECLDPAHIVTKSGKWDPEHWMSHDSGKHASGTAPATSGEDKGEANKRREKPREENDDYCFTPQRRSFVGGCQVTAARKQETETAAVPLVKEKGTQPRRPPLNQPQREQRGFQLRSQPGDKDSRRPLERTAFERDGGNRRVNGHHDRRHVEETPEWFFGGPTSQNETIELKGFDEQPGRGKRKAEPKKVTDETARETAAAKTEIKAEKEKEAPKEEKKQPEFNFDDLLNMDTGNFSDASLDALGGDSTPLQGSKFSRWFKKPEEEKKPEEVSMKDKEDAAKSLLEMLHKGSEEPVQQQQQQQPKLQGVLTAEEVERMANKRNALVALKNLLPPPPNEAANRKEGGPAARPMTEQDLLASLLGDKMNVNKAPPQQNPPSEDILTRFLQTASQQQHAHKQPEPIQQQPPALPPSLQELQQRAAFQSMLNAAAAGLNGPPTLQQLELLAKQRQLMQVHQQLQQQQQRQAPPVKSSSASPLAFTPTAVMRKMTADKDKDKLKGQAAADKTPEDAGVAQNQGANTRLTGRTASQVAGPETHSSGMLPTAASVAGPPLQQLLPPPLAAFGNPMNPGNAITDMALRLLEQQQQQQLLARAVAVSAAQNQLKQAIKQQQQQRVSPLQQPLLPHQGPPMMPRNHFRPIHAQPSVGPGGPGFAPFLAGTLPPPGQQQQQPRGAAPRLHELLPNMSIQQQMAAALQAQRVNSLPNGRPTNGAQQGGGANNSLARWLAQELPLQGPPVPNP